MYSLSPHCSASSVDPHSIGALKCPRPISRCPMLPREEHRGPKSKFSLRPISPIAFTEDAMRAPDRPFAPRSPSSHSMDMQPTRNSNYPSSPSGSKERQDDPTPVSPSLSVLNAPTAVFMWPNLSMSSGMGRLQVGSDSDMEGSEASVASSSVASHPSDTSFRKRKTIRAWEDPVSAFTERKHSEEQSVPIIELVAASEGMTLSAPPTADRNQKWEEYASQMQLPDGGPSPLWKCDWDASGVRCSYNGKKQLVKRHVETTHMKIKRFVCDICLRAFPQKTARDGHRNTHSDDRPYTCETCGQGFKDLSRKHRHKVKAHGYVPKQAKRTNMGDL